MVVTRRVAMGTAAGGFEQAVGIRNRKDWYRHKMSRKQLPGGHIRSEGAGWWWQRGAGGGARGLRGMDRTDSGGERSRDSGGQRNRQQ